MEIIKTLVLLLLSCAEFYNALTVSNPIALDFIIQGGYFLGKRGCDELIDGHIVLRGKLLDPLMQRLGYSQT